MQRLLQPAYGDAGAWRTRVVTRWPRSAAMRGECSLLQSARPQCSAPAGAARERATVGLVAAGCGGHGPGGRNAAPRRLAHDERVVAAALAHSQVAVAHGAARIQAPLAHPSDQRQILARGADDLASAPQRAGRAAQQGGTRGRASQCQTGQTFPQAASACPQALHRLCPRRQQPPRSSPQHAPGRGALAADPLAGDQHMIRVASRAAPGSRAHTAAIAAVEAFAGGIEEVPTPALSTSPVWGRLIAVGWQLQ